MKKSEIALRTENLSVGYTKSDNARTPKILCEALNLDLSAGTLTCLLGRNGVGKSTLLKVLAGLQNEISGQIFWGEKDSKLLDQREKAKTLAVIN